MKSCPKCNVSGESGETRFCPKCGAELFFAERFKKTPADSSANKITKLTRILVDFLKRRSI